MDWYRQSFGLDYLDIYSHRDAAEGAIEAARIVELLGLDSAARVLDVACGSGRHTRAFRDLGLRATGIDLSIDLLGDARSRETGANQLYVNADMRNIPFRDAFDAAVSLFTSFGYFGDESDDQATLRALVSSLRAGGKFLLDFLNKTRVVETLDPRSEELKGGLRICHEREISSDGRRILKTIRVHEGDDPAVSRIYHESVRLYDLDDLTSMMQAAGFRAIRAIGSFKGEAHSPSSPRLILIGTKQP